MRNCNGTAGQTVINRKDQTLPQALITGASGGIGLELAKLFAKDKYDLVLIARSADKLSAIADSLKKEFSIKASVIAKDLSKPSSARELYDELERCNADVHVLVNNAGFGSNGSFVDSDFDNDLEMMNLNMISLVTLTKLLLPHMVKSKEGKILNIASTAAFVAGANMAIYYASKAFVLSFSEALYFELKGTGVTVTCLCPGPTSTGFQQRASAEKIRLFKAQSVMKAKDVAIAGYRALMKRKRLKIPGLLNKIAVLSIKFTPRRASIAVTKWLNS